MKQNYSLLNVFWLRRSKHQLAWKKSPRLYPVHQIEPTQDTQKPRNKLTKPPNINRMPTGNFTNFTLLTRIFRHATHFILHHHPPCNSSLLQAKRNIVKHSRFTLCNNYSSWCCHLVMEVCNIRLTSARTLCFTLQPQINSKCHIQDTDKEHVYWHPNIPRGKLIQARWKTLLLWN